MYPKLLNDADNESNISIIRIFFKLSKMNIWFDHRFHGQPNHAQQFTKFLLLLVSKRICESIQPR